MDREAAVLAFRKAQDALHKQKQVVKQAEAKLNRLEDAKRLAWIALQEAERAQPRLWIPESLDGMEEIHRMVRRAERKAKQGQ